MFRSHVMFPWPYVTGPMNTRGECCDGICVYAHPCVCVKFKHTNGCLYGSMRHAAATIWSTAIQNPTTIVWFPYHSWSWALTVGQNMYFDGGCMHMRIVGHKKDTIFWRNFKTFFGVNDPTICRRHHYHARRTMQSIVHIFKSGSMVNSRRQHGGSMYVMWRRRRILQSVVVSLY